MQPDEWYQCPAPACDHRTHDQIAHERHLAAAHGRLRDVIPAVRTALE